MTIATIRKALTGGVTAGVAAYTAAAADGIVDTRDWITIGVAVAVGLGLVYGVPNAAPADPTVGDSPYVPDLVASAEEPTA
jgi:hypothetical protein